MPKYVKEVDFIMWKKIFLSVGIIIILVIGIELFNYYQDKKIEEQSSQNVVQSETELSNKYVTDDCIDEWEDYATTIEQEIQETNQSLNDENRHYIIKEKDNLISIYYINENQEEILYRVTDISTEYLSEEDIESLRQGIDVYGMQNLNQLIEDLNSKEKQIILI